MERLVERVNGHLALTKDFPDMFDALVILMERAEIYEDILFADKSTLRLPLKELDALVKQAAQEKAKQSSAKHYFFIIGAYINYPMGACTSEGALDVFDEESAVRLYPISEKEYKAYWDDGTKPPKSGFDWMAHSLTRKEVEELLKQ